MWAHAGTEAVSNALVSEGEEGYVAAGLQEYDHVGLPHLDRLWKDSHPGDIKGRPSSQHDRQGGWAVCWVALSHLA